MKNTLKLSFLALLIMTGFTFTACEEDDDDDVEMNEPFTTTQADIDNSTFVVGTYDTAESSLGAHGGDNTIRDVYASTSEGLDYRTVITKRIYAKEENGDKGDLTEVYAMVKHEAGYNPDGGDWEWIIIPGSSVTTENPNGMLSEARLRSKEASVCISCHRVADGDDFSFVR